MNSGTAYAILVMRCTVLSYAGRPERVRRALFIFVEVNMLIPVLHFNGECADAIALYEKAFKTKAENYDYGENNRILHVEMIIHGQRIYLNDARDYIKNAFGIDCATHLDLTFKTSEELLACYEILKRESTSTIPFVETPYSRLCGNFIDRLGVLWGLMVVDY